jgi:hypothetical protein
MVEKNYGLFLRRLELKVLKLEVKVLKLKRLELLGLKLKRLELVLMVLKVLMVLMVLMVLIVLMALGAVQALKVLMALGVVQALMVLWATRETDQVAEQIAAQLNLEETLNRVSNHKTSLLTGKLSRILPEDWRGEVEAVRQRLINAKSPSWVINLRTAWCLLELFWAAVHISWDNLGVAVKKETEKYSLRR